MIFSSYKFIFIFLPIVYIGYLMIRKLNKPTYTKIWLILASIFFYAQASVKLTIMFLITIVFNYIIGKWIVLLKNKDKNKNNTKDNLKDSKDTKNHNVKINVPLVLLWIGLLENLALLGYYKYTNFFISNVNAVLGTEITFKKILLPLGISFFTFQLINYLVDSYRKNDKATNFIDYMVLITFFPKLIVGPIVDTNDMLKKISDDKVNELDYNNIMCAIINFSIGCAKKVIIADALISYAQAYYDKVDVSGFYESWTAVLSYTFAYYFDFSGYIDMAIGLALLFNIKLPINFNSPYKARNFADFWRRWNITISNFLYKHIFNNVYKFGERMWKLFLATMITFIVSGIWHGAGWNFILWGVMNGIFVCMANYMQLKQKKLPFWLAWFLTFFGSIMVRVMFDSKTVMQSFKVYIAMFDLSIFSSIKDFIATGITFVTSNVDTIILLIIAAVITFGFKNINDIDKNFKPSLKYALLAGILLAISLFKMGAVSNFLYFQF